MMVIAALRLVEKAEAIWVGVPSVSYKAKTLLPYYRPE
jgi:hypothetical protein